MAYDENNVFARILREEIPAVRVYEDEQTLAFMDVMPQSSGHTLVIAKTAAENLFDLPPEAAIAVMRTTQRVARAVQTGMRADGIMLNQFNGACAGQSVFHFHMHIVPRYEGTSLRRHSDSMEDSAVLEANAVKIREALADTKS